MIDIQSQLIAPTLAYIEDKIQGYAATAELLLSSWQEGDVGEQILQATVPTIHAFTGIITGLTRSGFGDTAMDPGDDPDDPDPDYTAPKWLSYWGEGDMGTKRFEEGFASGYITLTNAADGETQSIAPFDKTFTRDTANSDGTFPTYRNAPDDSIYLLADGTFNLEPGQVITIPIIADVVGTASDAGIGEITTLTTTTLGVTVANAAPVLGSNGEGRAHYVARCRQAAAVTSPAGAADSYRYLSTTLPGGDPLLNSVGAAVKIVETYVTVSSATGKVDCYYRSNTGAPLTIDVTAANANIIKYGLPLSVTFGPSLSPVGGIAAVATPISITYTAKIKDVPGLDLAEVYLDVKAALSDYLLSVTMGGFDTIAGAGKIYTVDLAGEIKAARRDRNTGAKWGLYDVVVTVPGTSFTAIALGHFGEVNGTPTGTVTPV